MAEEPRDPSLTESTEPFHVLLAADSDAFAHFGRMFRRLGFALINEGLHVSLLTDDPGAAEDLDGTPVIDYLVDSFRGVRAWRLGNRLDELFPTPPSVVHVWGVEGLSRLSRWAAQHRLPLVIHVTSTRQVDRLIRRGLREHEHVLAGCATFAERLHERWPTLGDAIGVFAPALLAAAEVPPFAVNERTLGVVWTGRLDRAAGLELLIEAIARLRAKSVDLQLALLGRGPATRTIWKCVRDRGVADCVSLTELGARVWDRALAGADLYVVPACHDELSLAPLLAMADGKIVIASRDQIAEWFIENETSLQFAPGSADDLAETIGLAVSGHPNVPALARAAAEYARRNHAITELASRLVDLYRALIGTEQGGGGVTIA